MDSTNIGSTAYVSFLCDGESVKYRKTSFKRLWKYLLTGLVFVSCCVAFVTLYVLYGGSVESQVNNHTRHLKSVLALTRPVDIILWSESDFESEFKNFVSVYNKSYADEAEYQKRYKVFKKNLLFIHLHNEQKHSFTLGMNHLGDMTVEEYRQRYTGYKVHSTNPAKKSKTPNKVAWELSNVKEDELPTEVDWRKRGCVTEVKDQAHCGSCWAFSTTGSVEGALCFKTGKLPDLSEQQLVDCAAPEGNLGCDGGEADWGFQYVLDNKGLCTEQEYPYAGHVHRHCRERKCDSAGDIKEFRDVPPFSELALRAAVAKHGPVSVAIEADEIYFQFYKSGVFSGKCGTQLDHATLVVGYGTDEATKEDYFIMKNSWGLSWGEAGYMRISRFGSHIKNNGQSHKHKESGECGLYAQPSFAVA